MSKSMLMTNEDVLRAAGVSDAEIALIKSADVDMAVHTLSPIHEKLMAFVYEQRIEWANARNPFAPLERSYASYNGGIDNGFFSETLVPMRDQGTNKLFGGRAYKPKDIRNPWQTQDYGKEPMQYVYGINAPIEREIDSNMYDFLMFFRRGSLIDYANSRVVLLDAENTASRELIENGVLNNEKFQYLDYASAPVYDSASKLDDFMYEVFDSVNYTSKNTKFKRSKFNTVRGSGNLVMILESQFWHDFAQKFQINNFLKPFVYEDATAGEFGVRREFNRIIKVPELTPTTIATNKILDPLNQTAATLPANTKLVGRIVDINAIKFGIGMRNTTSFMLNARTQHYNEISDYLFNMCDAYTNVPLLVSTDFKSDRVFHIVDDTPAPAPSPAS